MRHSSPKVIKMHCSICGELMHEIPPDLLIKRVVLFTKHRTTCLDLCDTDFDFVRTAISKIIPPETLGI